MTTAQDLSPADIVKWFRAQARQFNSMADNVEQTFKLTPQKERTPLLPNLATINVGDVRDALTEKAMRVGDIAKQFNVSTAQVEMIIEANEGAFDRRERGWIALKKPEPH